MHLHPLTPTPHRHFPALGATLLGHMDLNSAPRSKILPGLRHDMGNAAPSAQDRFTRLPRSPLRWVATFNAINNLATLAMPVTTQTGQHDVVMTHDPTSQGPYMSASTYVRIESLAKLHRMWGRGDAVYKVWPWQGSQPHGARIIAEAWVTVSMAGQGEQDQLVEMKMNASNTATTRACDS